MATQKWKGILNSIDFFILCAAANIRGDTQCIFIVFKKSEAISR
jgi:hypothetical protein